MTVGDRGVPNGSHYWLGTGGGERKVGFVEGKGAWVLDVLVHLRQGSLHQGYYVVADACAGAIVVVVVIVVLSPTQPFFSLLSMRVSSSRH